MRVVVVAAAALIVGARETIVVGARMLALDVQAIGCAHHVATIISPTVKNVTAVELKSLPRLRATMAQ